MRVVCLRKWLAAVSVSAVVLVAALGAGEASAFKDKDCSDFKTQKKAQKFFKKHKPKKDKHGLDADNDGIACEDNPCPCKKKPAFRIGYRAIRLSYP